MKIISIECLHLRLPYEDRIRTRFHHFGMTEEHTVYRFHTDSGLVGLGESVGAPFADDMLEPYIGTDPVDHLMGSGRFNLDMACYDLVGKQLGQPAWKLMGPQVREWVSMGWWSSNPRCEPLWATPCGCNWYSTRRESPESGGFTPSNHTASSAICTTWRASGPKQPVDEPCGLRPSGLRPERLYQRTVELAELRQRNTARIHRGGAPFSYQA